MDSNLEKLLEKYDISIEEKNFISSSNTAVTAEMNYTKLMAQFILTKQLASSTEKIITSSQAMAKSQDKHSRKMQYLTYALIFVGVIQAVAMMNL